ncbi:MAG TPA: TIGR02647 family protein [Cellvibrionaceae bacterium]
MSISSALINELVVLRSFDVSGTQIGIKVHSDAAPELVAAAQRLYEKQLITQPDGGYLTALGFEAAVHAQQALQILTSSTTV